MFIDIYVTLSLGGVHRQAGGPSEQKISITNIFNVKLLKCTLKYIFKYGCCAHTCMLDSFVCNQHLY
jgi:hypothetical protein